MYGVVKKESLADFGIRNITAYATEVNLDRAVPELYDGLKPVLRRVLWSAYHFKSGEAVKSAKIVGHCFAKGTKVLLANGKEVNIEDCCVGDEVLTDKGSSVITDLFVNRNCDLYRITLDDGSYVDVTSDQILYCVDKDGKEVSRTPLTMQVGDKIKSVK